MAGTKGESAKREELEGWTLLILDSLQMMSIPSAPTDDSPLGTDNASLL
jgi:hypothetical protein